MRSIPPFLLLLLVPVAVLAVGGCGAEVPETNVADSTISSEGAPDSSSDRSGSKSRKTLKYSIEKSTVVRGIKRALFVRLNRKATEDELRELALKLKSLDGNQYQRTFIRYYLPGRGLDEGDWARSDFNPTLEIQVYGLSIKDDEVIDRDDSTIPGEILGRWSDETMGLPACYTLFRNGGKTYIKMTFKDVSSSVIEVVEKPSGVGTRYDEPESEHGEYFLVDASRTLKRGDTRGIWQTMQPVERPLNRQLALASSSAPQQPNDSTGKLKPHGRTSTEELVVSLSVEPRIQADRRAVIVGKTNLPADTELAITVKDAVIADRTYQTGSSVLSDGTYQSEPLGQLSGLEDGWYIASATMPVARTQPEHVRQVIGEKGDILTGPLVERITDWLGASVHVETKFLVGDDNAARNQAARLRKDLDEVKEIARQIKELYSRLEESKSKGLFDESKYSIFEIGTTYREFYFEHKRVSDRVDEIGPHSPSARHFLGWPLADFMNMLRCAKNEEENEYREVRAQYLYYFKALEDLIRERELKLSTSALDFAAEPGTDESRAGTALETVGPIGVDDERFRVWTGASGKYSVEAKIVSFANGIVALENREGRQIKVDLEKFSEADREFVEKWRSSPRN